MTFAAQALAVAGAVMLILSGTQHVANYRPLLASMLAHKVLAYRVARATARTVPAAQITCGAAALAVLATPLPDDGFGRLAPAACLALYLALSAYLAAILSSGGSAQCACFGRSEPVTWFSLVRTVLPALGFAGVVLRPDDPSGLGIVAAVLLGSLLAALAVSRNGSAPVRS